MKTSAKFKEYVWLVNIIYKSHRISFAEIQKKWLQTELSEGVELARSTFNRHKDAIEDIFGIYIDCDRSDGYKYYIGNEEVLEENSIQNWMLSTLSVNNIIRDSLSLQDRILLEPIPSEGEYLQQVIKAMKQKVRIEISYLKYGSEQPKLLNIEPYCIKLFKQRWYVLGHFHRDATEEKPASDYHAIFSFDRIKEIKLTDVKFEINPNFNARDYFKDSYGVYVDDEESTSLIVLRAYGKEQYYMRDLPIHPSQKNIQQNENYADFELNMRPTRDFCSYILSRGSLLKVLYPDWLAEEIVKMHQESAELYNLNDGEVVVLK